MTAYNIMAFRLRCLLKFIMASPSRRNVFIRLFGLLAMASLFASYLMFVQVNADNQRVRISGESPRRENKMAVRRAPERSSDKKSKRRETILEPPELKESSSIRLRGNLRSVNSREHTSLRESSETDDVARLRHAKKLKFSVLKDVFRDKRSRRTGDSYTDPQTDGEKYEDEFRGNARMRGTFTDSATSTSTPGSSLKAKSSIIADSIRGNRQSYKVFNRPVESRKRDAVKYTQKPVGSSSLDDLSLSTSSHRIANERMEDKTVVDDVNKPSRALGGYSTNTGESFQNTAITHRTMNKESFPRSTTVMANVNEPDLTRRVNLQVVRDTYRQGIITAPTTYKKHLEHTSKTTIEDAKDSRPTPRSNIARVTVLKQQKFEYVRDIVTPGVTSSRRNLIIVAQPRTGSSFLGDAFNQHPDVFYLFEPLHGVVETPLQHLTNRKPMQFLSGMLNCKFESITYVKQIEKFRRFSSNALSSPPMCARKTFVETPRKKCDPLSTRNMENVCKRNYSITVMKILTSRIPNGKIDSLFPLCNSSNCTVIYLVRDPRPVIFSHMKVGIQSWQYFDIRANDNAPRPSIKMYSARVCRQIEENVKIFQNLTGSMKNKYLMLRYEDLSRNPTETLQRLYKLAGLEMVNSTLQWIRVNTGEGRSTVRSMRDYNYSTKRNSKAALDKWRLEIDPCVVRIIEDSCRSVLKLLGYKLLNGSEQVQYDLNVSLSDGQ